MQVSRHGWWSLKAFFCCAFFGLSISTASACEFYRNSWPNLFSFLYEPTAKRYRLKLPDASTADVKVQKADIAIKSSSIGSSKRLRIVSGYTLEIDQHRDLKSNAVTLAVDSTQGLFNGSLSLSTDERVRQIRFTTLSAGTPNYLINIYYNELRPTHEAIQDLICTYESAPSLYEEDQ